LNVYGRATVNLKGGFIKAFAVSSAIGMRLESQSNWKYGGLAKVLKIRQPNRQHAGARSIERKMSNCGEL